MWLSIKAECNFISLQLTFILFSYKNPLTVFSGTLNVINLVPGITFPRAWYFSHLKIDTYNMYYKSKLMATHNFKLMFMHDDNYWYVIEAWDHTYSSHFQLPQIYVSKIFQKLMQPFIQNIEVYINQLSTYRGKFGAQKFFSLQKIVV